MAKVLFTHSYFYKLDQKQWRFRQPYPPLGTITAASYMRDHGFEVSLFDTNLRDSPDELILELRKNQAKYLVIYDDGFNYLTKMCLTVMRDAAMAMAKIGKRFGCTVIVSSSDSADHFEKYFPNGVDFVLKGEGEETLKELLQCLEVRKDPSEIPGLVFRRSGKTIVTTPRKLIHHLDALPLPAWDLVAIDDYKKIWKKHHGYFSLNIATTRGCPYKCNWCAKPIYGNRYTARSAEHVISEIEMLLNNYQPDHFWISDDIFGLKPGWVKRFGELVAEKRLSFKYKIQSRVDLLLEEDNIESLHRSGLETVWVGAESGSQKILDAMDKGTTIEQIHEATTLLKHKGVRVGFFLQFGYLGETSDDIQKTIDMVLKLLPDEVGISVSYPLPGTKFYEIVKHQLQQKQNWSDSDDLDMMYNGTFTSAYYRQLHRYVHSIYRKEKGHETLKKLLRNPMTLNYRDLRNGLGLLYFSPKAFAEHRKLRKLQTS